MLSGFITEHAEFLIVAGMILGIASGSWLLFAAYSCDVALARWMLIFPPLALLFVIRYPETCLRPFLLSLFAIVMIVIGCAFSVVKEVNAAIEPDQSTLSK